MNIQTRRVVGHMTSGRALGFLALISLAGVLLPYWYAGLIEDAKSSVAQWQNWTLAFVAIVAAFFLYLVRCRWKLYYGLLEISVAFATTFHAIAKVREKIAEVGFWSSGDDPDSALAWMAILAAIYVGVRGFDNMVEGAKELVAKDQLNEITDVTKNGQSSNSGDEARPSH